LGKCWSALDWKMLIYLKYFMDIWDTLWPFGTFCVHLVHFSGFGIMYQEKSGNPGTCIHTYIHVYNIESDEFLKTGCSPIHFFVSRRNNFFPARPGWPDWPNFRQLGDCLLGAVFWKLQKWRKFLDYFFPWYHSCINFDK
jgi:hypothetical protein